MSKLTRRNFIKGMGLSGAVIGLASMSELPVSRPVLAQDAVTLGTITQIRRGPVTLHTYIAPDVSSAVTTHIIETENRIVIVDAQFLQTFSREVRSYVDRLGKPVDRLILSHEHPDHWFGANHFTDFAFYATPNTIANVNHSIEEGIVTNLASLLGDDEVPDQPNVPSAAITSDSEVIDNVTFEYATYANNEAQEMLVIGLPEARTLIVQDLLYNNIHFFPGQDRDNWIATLESLKTMDNYDLLLVGHGLPTTLGEIDLALDYLTFVQETLPTVTNPEELITIILDEYPTFGGRGLIEFWRQFFPTS